MKEYMQSLPDGWTIYLWIVAAAGIILASIIAILWARKHGQFDEDVKYLVFDEKDKDKMEPEEFEKAKQVNKEQMELREKELKEIAARKAAKHEKR